MYRVLKFTCALSLVTVVLTAIVSGAAAQGLLGDVVDGTTDVANSVAGLVDDTSDGAPDDADELLQGLTGGNGTQAGTFANEQEAALRAVRTGQALPLNEILFIAQLNYEGDVIDVHLVTVDTILLYQLTFLAPDGEVFDTYFYAATGIPVKLRN